MPYVVADRVKETSTSTGTGNFALAGAATGFKTFSSTVGVGNTTTYVITDASGGQWEVGLGNLTTSTTLVRIQVFSNSQGNTNFVNFLAGTKNVFVTLSAEPRNNNVAFGNNLGFSPQSYQYNTVIGPNASVGADYATAVGQFAVANGSNGVALGGAASASGASSTALGQQASAIGSSSVAVGVGAYAAAPDAISVGVSASTSGTSAISVGPGAGTNYNFGISIGSGSTANNSTLFPDGGISIGASSNTYGGITIGKSSVGGFSSGADAIIIGHGITALQNNATYMNKFRTGITPVGTSWFLKWDDVTNEVYADPGAVPPAGANWYTYETVAFPGGTFSSAMPSGMPTTSFGGGATLYSSQAVGGGSLSPSGTWSYNGSTGYYNGVWSASSPQADPTSYSGSAYGTVVVYYAGYETDTGAISTNQVNTSTSTYTNFTNNFYCTGFSVFGTTQYGHAIVIMTNNYVGSITPASGVTLVEEFYDSNVNYTFAFFELNTAAVSNASVGMPFASIPSSTGYETIFWYNYS